MALARLRKAGGDSRRNHIVSAIEDRNEPCADASFAMAIPMSNGIHSRAHPPTLVHARLLDICWTPTAPVVLNALK
jgi:hypothetical protein